jgi:RNA polymerase sigma factor (sigma-70 family)
LDIQPSDEFRLEQVLPAERERLVRLCARLSGSVEAAEDLAQETLIEAWRHRRKLHDPTGHAKWLTAITRHVCLRWRREHQQHEGRQVRAGDNAETPLSPDQWPADDGDVEMELEHHELAALLDRAMAHLPPDTRQILIQHYIDDLPQAEMAVRLGVSEGTIAVRLHRGKLALRRVLTRSFREEAISYGLITAEAAQWQETRIWCPLCGQRRLLGRFLAKESELALRCVAYSPAPLTEVYHGVMPAEFHGVKGYRALLTRMQAYMDRYYRSALPTGSIVCDCCGRLTSLGMGMPENAPTSYRGVPGLHVQCPACDGLRARSWIRLKLLSPARPEGRRFWREHPRIRALPEREIRFAGRHAILTSFESLPEHARFAVIYARDSYAPLDVCASVNGLDA